MKCEFIKFLLIGLPLIGIVTAQGTTELFLKKASITQTPNSYFGDWSIELHGPGDKVTIKTPVKTTLPPTIMMRVNFEMAGTPLPPTDMTMCEAFKDETIGKDVLSAGQPKGKFPADCPIKAGADFVISQYVIPNDKIPPGTPPGPFKGDFELYDAGTDSSVVVAIHIEGELAVKMPGPPGFGR